MLLGTVYFVHMLSVTQCLVCVRCFLVLRKQRGRLKICSESIVFDPLDFSHAVMKVLFVVRLCVQCCLYVQCLSQ